ncbi:DIL-domain-containing protein, partial [Basidiobolus meristosporus CBS 931.73]
MWASSNHHSTIVELLVEHGASTDCKSSKGRTVLDFLNRDKTIDPSHSQKIMELLADSQGGSENEEARENRYYAPSINDLESALAESDILYKMAMDNVNGNEIDLAEFQPKDVEEGEEMEFDWNSLQLDQMFVFSEKNLDSILESVISHMKPHYSKTRKFIPASWIFLAARYSHYLAGLDMLSELMTKAMSRIAAIIQVNKDDMSLLGFWLANCNLLLYYFKRDSELVASTVQQQFELSEIIHEIYQHFVANAEKRLLEVIDDAMMNYLTLPGIDQVQFIKERMGFFSSLTRKSPSSHSKANHTYRPQLNQKPVSPKTVNCILSSTLIVLQSYEVHPATIHYILNQLFYFLSAEIFNRILGNKEYCNRTKAMQIRMNLSVIEDWIHSNRLPSVLLFHFRAVIQALQYLQCVSSLPDLGSLVETAKELDQLTSTQMKHLAQHYRYEVDENQIQEEILQYLDKVVQDTVNRHAETLSSMKVNGEHMANVVELKADILNHERAPYETEPELDIWKNPDHMLPFAIPTTSEMLTGFGRSSREYVPQLPEEFIMELD